MSERASCSFASRASSLRAACGGWRVVVEGGGGAWWWSVVVEGGGGGWWREVAVKGGGWRREGGGVLTPRYLSALKVDDEARVLRI
jgi:hypothetical protein